MAFLYILACEGGSLYTGIATDLPRRMKQHTEGGHACAKYTRAHPPRALAAVWWVRDMKAAARLEYAVKQLPRPKKLLLLESPADLSHLIDREEIPCHPLPSLTLEDCLAGRMPPVAEFDPLSGDEE